MEGQTTAVCALRPCRQPATRSIVIGSVQGHVVSVRVCGDECEALAMARAAWLLDAVAQSVAPAWVGAPPRRPS